MIVFTDGDSNTLYDTPDAGNRCCGGGDSSVSLSMPIQKSGYEEKKEESSDRVLDFRIIC